MMTVGGEYTLREELYKKLDTVRHLIYDFSFILL